MKINSKEIEEISYNVARKRKKEIANNREKGITLIALVVTIVVLLILAGITITFVLGEGGILDMAKEAAKRTEDAKQKELEDFANFPDQVENWINGGSTSGGTTPPADPSPTPEQSTTKTLEEAKAQSDPFEDTTKVTDGKDTMTVPAGFKITEGESIDEGVVVQDRAKNEFVWVPVAINDMVMCRTHPTAKINYKDGEFSCEGQEHKPDQTELVGKLYATTYGNKFTAGTPNTTYTENSGIREPAIVTGSSNGEGTDYDAQQTYLDKVVEEKYQTGEKKTKEDFKKQLQEEFYNMAKSVAENGGFYIGRYETSSLNTDEPKVISGVSPTVSYNWYTMYKNSKEIAKGALKPEEKEQETKSSVTSSMIWGCQWDAVMNWMKNVTNSNKDGKYYITDSTGMGYYDQFDKTTTGSKEAYAVKNIYDMAGNVWEWTLEAFDNDRRISRGGVYYDSGSTYPASYRSYDDGPTDGLLNFGSRVALYVNL